MTLIAKEASAESLEGIGLFITPAAGPSPAPGAEYTFELAALGLGMPAGLCAGRLECAPRPMRVAKMERHLRTPELLSAVDGDVVVCVAPPQEPAGGRLEGLRAITLRRGRAIVMATGAWHWIPFPTGGANALVLVVFQAGTGNNDLHFCDLADKVDIELGAAK